MTNLTLDDFGRELLAQREWLARLARTLVADSATADDLVQDTWAAALRTRPRPDGGLRGWLATVLRHRAVSRQRHEARRAQREAAASRPESTGSTHDLVERAALQQEVVAAVMALEERYREVVLLRYFDDLPPRDIAQRLGVPVSTVKTRLGRAADQLRDRLDATWRGDRAAWVGALGVWLEGESTGGLSRILVAAAAGVVVVGGATFTALERSDRDDDPGLAAAAPEALPDPSLASGRRALDVDAPELERSPGPSAAGATRGPRGPRASASAPAFDGWGEAVHRVPWPKKTVTRLKEHGAAKGTVASGAAVPPGFSLVERYEGRIGDTLDDALHRIAAVRRLADSEDGATAAEEDLWAGWLAASTPQAREVVESFAIARTEVAVEQLWALWDGPGGGIEEGLAQRQALRALESPPLWSVREVHEPFEDKPVSHLSFEAARTLADLAGVRLPTETEFEAAVRGRRESDYPWGKSPGGATRAVVLDAKARAEPESVGSRKDAGKPLRAHDLLGNVWEWTDSPFVAREGWRSVASLAPQVGFDPERRVVRGGSFRTPGDAVSASLRRGLDPGSRLDDVGVRFAASLRPGLDRARAVLRGLPPELRLRDARGDLEGLLACDRWIATEPEWSSRAKDLAVIRRYDHVVWIPFDDRSRASFLRVAAADPGGLEPLGLLSTNLGVRDAHGRLPAETRVATPYEEGFREPEVFVVAYSRTGARPASGHGAQLFEGGGAALAGWPDEVASPGPSFVLLSAEGRAPLVVPALPWLGDPPAPGVREGIDLLARGTDFRARGLALPVRRDGAVEPLELRLWVAEHRLDGAWRHAGTKGVR